MIRYYQSRYRCIFCGEFDRITSIAPSAVAACQGCGEDATMIDSCQGWAKVPAFTDGTPRQVKVMLFGDQGKFNDAGRPRRKEAVSIRSGFSEACHRTRFKSVAGAKTQAFQMQRQHGREYTVTTCATCKGFHLEPMEA